MKTSHSVLVASAVGAAGLWLFHQHSRRQNELQAAQIHQAWLAEVAANPELRAVWAPVGEELTDKQHANLLHANRLISFLSAKFRVGLLDRTTLRTVVRRLMQQDAIRTYWVRNGGLREEEARDRADRTFNTILNDEYEYAAVA